MSKSELPIWRSARFKTPKDMGEQTILLLFTCDLAPSSGFRRNYSRLAVASSNGYISAKEAQIHSVSFAKGRLESLLLGGARLEGFWGPIWPVGRQVLMAGIEHSRTSTATE